MKDGSVEGAFSALIVAWPHFFHNLFAETPGDQVLHHSETDVMEFEQASSDRLFALNLWQALVSYLGCCKLYLNEEGPTNLQRTRTARHDVDTIVVEDPKELVKSSPNSCMRCLLIIPPLAVVI